MGTRGQGGAHVCCNLELVDGLEIHVSLPDVCTSATEDGPPGPVGSDRPQFLFAFHLQAVAPFGAVTSGKYVAPGAPRRIITISAGNHQAPIGT